MSDQIMALILTLAIFALLAVWVPILDILQGAVQDLRITKTSCLPEGAPVVGSVREDCPQVEENGRCLRVDTPGLISKPENETLTHS